MQEFKPLAMKLVWDPLNKLFVHRDAQQPNSLQRPGDTVFETESELVSNQQAEPKKPQEEEERTLWGYIKGNLF